MGLGIRGWRRVGSGICKVGGVGSRSNHAPWILCSAVRTACRTSFMREAGGIMRLTDSLRTQWRYEL